MQSLCPLGLSILLLQTLQQPAGQLSATCAVLQTVMKGWVLKNVVCPLHKDCTHPAASQSCQIFLHSALQILLKTYCSFVDMQRRSSWNFRYESAGQTCLHSAHRSGCSRCGSISTTLLQSQMLKINMCITGMDSLQLLLPLAERGCPCPVHDCTGYSEAHVKLLHKAILFGKWGCICKERVRKCRSILAPTKVPTITMVLVPRIITEKSRIGCSLRCSSLFMFLNMNFFS